MALSNIKLGTDGDLEVKGRVEVTSGLTASTLSATTISSPTITTINNNINTKQPTLVSGTNIKTINGTALLGSGDLVIIADSSDKVAKSGDTMSGQLNIMNNINIGSGNDVTGLYTFAQGIFTTASGHYSHVEGEGSTANNHCEHACGCLNVSTLGVSQDSSALTNDSQATLFSIGNGSMIGRKNAFEVKWNGDVYIWKNGNSFKLQDLI